MIVGHGCPAACGRGVRHSCTKLLAGLVQCWTRALDSGVPFGWVTDDETYGSDRNLRLWLPHGKTFGACSEASGGTEQLLGSQTDLSWRFFRVRAHRLAPGLDEPGWVRHYLPRRHQGTVGQHTALVATGDPAPEGAGQGILAAWSIAAWPSLGDLGLSSFLLTAQTQYDSLRPTGAPGRNPLDHPRMLCGGQGTRGSGPVCGAGPGRAGTGISPWSMHWFTPDWRWSGARRWSKEDARVKSLLSQLGRKARYP